MAEIESFMRDLVDSICVAINDLELPISSLRPELHALHAYNDFKSIQALETRNRHYWSSRIGIAELHFSSDVASLPRASGTSPQPPLNGSTINMHCISVVAKVFCFTRQADELISGRQQGALLRLHGHRNDFAHANVPPDDLFSDLYSAVTDVLDDMNEVSTVIQNLAKEWDSVIEHRLFLKPSTQ